MVNHDLHSQDMIYILNIPKDKNQLIPKRPAPAVLSHVTDQREDGL